MGAVWKKFLPYAEKCWQIQRESWSAGNCHDWWGSRFQSFFLGHGRPVEQRDYVSASMFPAVWEKYGQVMQSGCAAGIRNARGNKPLKKQPAEKNEVGQKTEQIDLFGGAI